MWTNTNPVSIGAPTKKSHYDKLWDNCDFFKIEHNTDGTHKFAYIYIRDEKSAGTNGGDFTQADWRTRILNTEVADAGGHATLSSNQITLAAGTYRFRASAPGYNVGYHKVRLRNITDGTTVAIGTTEVTATSVNDQTKSEVRGRFTIAASKVFELQHYCSTTKSSTGFGLAGSIDTEVYAEIEFWKES